MTSQYPSDYEILGERFKSQGYQRGLDEMDETILQSSFNVGFVHGVSTRFGNGYTRGLSTGMLLSSMLLKPALNPTTLPISKKLAHDDAADATDQSIHPATSHLLRTPKNAKTNFNTFDDELDSLPNALPAAKKAPKNSEIVHHMSIVPNFLPPVSSSAQTSSTSSSQPVSSPDSNTIALQPFQHNVILYELLLLITIQSKQLSSRQNPTFLATLKTADTPQKLTHWINTLPSGRWGVPFAKVTADIHALLGAEDDSSSKTNFIDPSLAFTKEYVGALCKATLDDLRTQLTPELTYQNQNQSNQALIDQLVSKNRNSSGCCQNDSKNNGGENIGGDTTKSQNSCCKEGKSTQPSKVRSSCCKLDGSNHLPSESACCESKPTKPSSQSVCCSNPSEKSTAETATTQSTYCKTPSQPKQTQTTPQLSSRSCCKSSSQSQCSSNSKSTVTVNHEAVQNELVRVLDRYLPELTFKAQIDHITRLCFHMYTLFDEENQEMYNAIIQAQKTRKDQIAALHIKSHPNDDLNGQDSDSDDGPNFDHDEGFFF